MRRRHLIAGVAGALLACLVAGGIAWASVPAADGTISACYKNKSGDLRVIDTAGQTCNAKKETMLTWSEGELWATVRSDGLKLAGTSNVTPSRLRTGVYTVTFPRDVTSCGLSISSTQYLGVGIIGVDVSTVDPPDLSHYFFTVVQDLSTANTLAIGERNTGGTLSDGPFTIAMTCS
jgi:hypothetical protein